MPLCLCAMLVALQWAWRAVCLASIHMFMSCMRFCVFVDFSFSIETCCLCLHVHAYVHVHTSPMYSPHIVLASTNTCVFLYSRHTSCHEVSLVFVVTCACFSHPSIIVLLFSSTSVVLFSHGRSIRGAHVVHSKVLVAAAPHGCCQYPGFHYPRFHI